MRFIHMADVHLDSPFTVLTDKKDFGTNRRLEQRETFKKSIEYIAKEKIPYLFISGDLYDQDYIRESTVEFINNLFKQIPETKIFISPGNHDPFLKNSFYNTFNWNNNVTIFKNKIETIEFEDVDIYGFGFADFYCEESEVEKIKIKDKNKINILIIHGSLDASKKLDMQYNPINSNKLKEIGFDYVALGHIHKSNYNENKNNFIYPGSLISFGFDELGEHGILDVILEKENKNINLNNLKNKNNYLDNSENKNNYLDNSEKLKNKNNNLEKINLNNEIKIENKIKINFIKLDNRIFEEKNINISELNSIEEIVEKLNSIRTNEDSFYKIILIGSTNISINTKEICKLITNYNILKIENRTEMKYDLEKLSEQNNLRGIFLKKMIRKLRENECDEEEIKKAIEIGLKAFE